MFCVAPPYSHNAPLRIGCLEGEPPEAEAQRRRDHGVLRSQSRIPGPIPARPFLLPSFISKNDLTRRSISEPDMPVKPRSGSVLICR